MVGRRHNGAVLKALHFGCDDPLDRLPTDEELDVQVEQSVYEEPIHYPPENALPDAPAHSAPDASAPKRQRHKRPHRARCIPAGA